MNVFEAVKQNVTTRQAAELYGIRVGRNGMAVCPFHNDKNPSMKLDRRFHCFGCQADGDAVDFVSRLFGLPSKEAAMKIADDFGISYDSRQKPSIRPKIREPTPEQKYQQEENHCYKVLSDYFHLLRKWEKQYAPQRTDEVWHPLFVEALQKKSYIEYLLDILLYDCALPGFVDSKNEEKTERNAGYLVVSQSGGGMLRQGTRKGIRRTPANRGMRAHRIVKSLDISEDVCHGLCP